MKGYSLPSGFDKDIDKFAQLILSCKQGQISLEELKARRVPFGIYEQRKLGTYMMRVRCAAGFLTPGQLETIADLSSRYGQKALHLTTRQEIQIHNLSLESLIPIIRVLKKIGLASRGGGGNTVRNITAQVDSGIAKDELFDVSGYALALTTRLIAEADSWTLPRKFKVAFSGSSQDRGYATLADLGFIAQIKDGQKGFAVYAAGGMGAKPSEGHSFLDFVSEGEVYNVTKAIKSIFWKYGNRKNKHANRLRFLWQFLGEKEFRKKFDQEYTMVKKENYPQLEVPEIKNQGLDPQVDTPRIKEEEDFSLWRKRFVEPQKQQGLYSIIIPVELGFIGNEEVRKLSQFLKPFGDNLIRLSKDQNIHLRNIKEKYLAHFYIFLKKNSQNFNRPFIYDKLISCAGASTCQLGICLSRGAASAIMDCLEEAKLDLDKVADLKINISGCSNSCGQHQAADLGFFGKANRKNGQLYPAYNVVSGAVIGQGTTKFSQKTGEISARDLPKLVKDFLSSYISKSSDYKDFPEYIQKQGRKDLALLCDKYKEVPVFAKDKDYYYDWGAKEVFSLAGRGMGECSAGLFDLIDVDLKNIKQTEIKLSQLAQDSEGSQKQELLLKLTFYSSRMLLITRGLEPKSAGGVYQGFQEEFIDSNLVDNSFKEIIAAAENKNYQLLLGKEKKIKELIARVEFLYAHMDDAFSFGFKEKEQTASDKVLVKDFRGIACPMNFVKTKIELAKLSSQELLEVWLDDGEPIENVPGSVKEEGHKIIEEKKVDNYWKVLIQRK